MRMAGGVRNAVPFLMLTGTLVLCRQVSATSMGHPLPVPLKDRLRFPHPLGSDTPLLDPGTTAFPPLAHEPFQDNADEEYDYSEDPTLEPRTPGHLHPNPERCQYSPCQHLQVPCAEMRRTSGCLCPGISGPSVAPEPPRLQTVHVSEEGASLHWCAPSSTVLGYRLWYEPVGGSSVTGPVLNSTFRLAAVSGLEPNRDYLFCVVASNHMGFSPVDRTGKEFGPCRFIHTPANQMPYIYIAVGLAVALVLIVCSAMVWHFCFRKKSHAHRGSMDNILDGEPGIVGAANSSFRSEEQL